MTPTDAGSAPRPAGSRPLLLADLADLVGVPVGGPAGGTPIHGVTLASSEVRAGDLYAALPGARTHGIRYVGDAAARGAVAVLTDDAGRDAALASGLPVCVVDDPRAALGAVADRVYGEPSSRLAVVGITGTNGKTTTAYLVEAGLAAAGLGTGLIGTVQTRTRGRDDTGRPTVTEIPSVRTTPEAPALHALLASMVDAGVSAVVMEVSSHALVMGRVGGVRFAAAGFTNLGRDHLDFHADLEDYFQAKARLFDGRAARDVVTVDDDAGRRLAGMRPAAATVSITGPADWTATAVAAAREGGSTFTLHGPDGRSWAARVRLPGRFNVANAVLAVALLDAIGVPVEAALAGIADTVVPGRMEPVEAGQPFVAVVDYAHTPDAVATALTALRDGTTGRLITVLGCGGDRDPGQAGGHGYLCGPAQRCPGRDRRQPTFRGSCRRPRGDAHRRRRPAGGRAGRRPRDRRPPGGDRGGRRPGRARRHRAGRGQGPRDRAGDRRHGAPLRRPRGAARGARGFGSPR